MLWYYECEFVRCCLSFISCLVGLCYMYNGRSWNVHDSWCDVILRDCATVKPAACAVLTPLWRLLDISIVRYR